MKIIDKIKRWWENKQMVWHLYKGDIGWFYNRPSVKKVRETFNNYLDQMLEAELMTEEEHIKAKLDGIKAEAEGMKELSNIMKRK